jgi:transposase
MGENLRIDETWLISGEVYTLLTNKEGHGGKGTLVAVIRGTKTETVIAVLEMICPRKRKEVEEITLDLSSSMMLIARTVFPKARITNDRFHVQKLYYDALDELRITLRRMARDMENEEIKRCREEGVAYIPFRYANVDTRKQLLARANVNGNQECSDFGIQECSKNGNNATVISAAMLQRLQRYIFYFNYHTLSQMLS